MTKGTFFQPLPDLTGSVWRLSTGDGTLIAPVVRLLRNGVIGGHVHTIHRRWVVRDDALVFVNADGIATTVFTVIPTASDECGALEGPLLGDRNVMLVLQRIEMPAYREDQRDGSDSSSILRERIDNPRRDNLVVICANEKSLHHQWTREIGDVDRNWDLCVTRYDQEPATTPPPYEYLAHQPRMPKFNALYNLFFEDSPLWNYSHIWLPDDDLMTSWLSINRMFEVCHRHGLQLAQPSLLATSHVNHAITRQDPQFALRFTSFVEIMCPVFSQDALRTCVPTFRKTVSAYGLDHIWPRLLGSIGSNIGVVDSIAVAHTRPLGQNYDLQSAIAEGHQMQRLYGAPASYETLGGIRRSHAELL